MPLIGDELRTILGMMPVRDRAGIARGTMADDAARAEAAVEQGNGNAEGQALTMQGMAPPPINLPGMRPAPPPQGDVTLPDDVAADYASGRKKTTGAPYGYTPLPIPSERVVTSSPAAAPSAAVATRASDVYLAAMQQRERQQKMMQLVGSIGLLANAFNRNPQSQASTRSSLSDMIGGGAGGGGGGLSDIKTLADMRAAEDKSIIDAKKREDAIKHNMVTQGWSRERSEYMVDSGNAAKFDDPKELRERQGIVDKEQLKNRLRPMATEIAKARGTNVRVIETMIEDNPTEAAKLAEAAGIEALRGTRLDSDKKEIDVTKELQELKAWKTELDRLTSDPNTTPDQIAGFARSPSAMKTGFTKQAELEAGRGEGSRKEIFENYMKKERPLGVTAENYIKTTAIPIGEMWHPDLKAGTLSEFRRSVARAYQTFWDPNATPNLNDTAQVDSLLKQGVLRRMQELGGSDTDKDVRLGKEILGTPILGVMELRGVVAMNEKNARDNILSIREKQDAYRKQNPKMAAEFDNLPKIEMPEPSKILKDDLYAPENQPLRDKLQAYAQQVIAKGGDDVSQQQLAKAKKAFDRQFGAEMADYYLNNPRRP